MVGQSVHSSPSLPILPPHTFPLLLHVLSVGRTSFRKYSSCSSVVLPELQCGYHLLHHGPSHGCKGNSAPVPGAPPPLLLSLRRSYLCVSLLSPPPLSAWCLLPFLKYAFPEAPPSWLLGSAVPCCGSIGASWNRLCPAQGSPGLSSQRLPLQPLCYQILDTYTQCNFEGQAVLWPLLKCESISLKFPTRRNRNVRWYYQVLTDC